MLADFDGENRQSSWGTSPGIGTEGLGDLRAGALPRVGKLKEALSALNRGRHFMVTVQVVMREGVAGQNS